MTRICILGDAHLLYQADWIDDEKVLKEEASEVLENFQAAVRQVASESPEAVIFAGDMLDFKTQSGQRVAHREGEKYMLLVRDILRELAGKTGCKIYAIRGNHDSDPVLRSLQNSLGGIFVFAQNETINIGELRIGFMSTHYVAGQYSIPLENISQADMLIMHESVPIANVLGPSKQNIVEICKRFRFVFNGHMHFYQERALDIPNLYLLPAFIPSRRIKNNWILKYHWEDGQISQEEQESPFGYLMFDGNKVRFKRYKPLQTIVRVELIGSKIEEFLLGIQRIYGLLIERPDAERLWVWVRINGDKITAERVIWPQVLRYSQIKTIEVEPERPEVSEAPVPAIEEAFAEAAFTREELIEKLGGVLSVEEWKIARSIFQEVLTPELLQSRNPDEREAFKRLLEVVSRGKDVSETFVLRAWEISK